MVRITKSNVKKPSHSDEQSATNTLFIALSYRNYDAAYREMTYFLLLERYIVSIYVILV